MRNTWTHTASTYTLMRAQELKKRPQRNGRKRLVICSLENKTEITEKVKEALQKCGASFLIVCIHINGKIDLFQNEKQGEICQHEKRVS